MKQQHKYQVSSDWHDMDVWATSAKEAVAKAKKQIGAGLERGEKFEASRYASAQSLVREDLQQQYKNALQENARLKSPRRAPIGPKRQAAPRGVWARAIARRDARHAARRGTNHVHPAGPRKCPKCGV